MNTLAPVLNNINVSLWVHVDPFGRVAIFNYGNAFLCTRGLLLNTVVSGVSYINVTCLVNENSPWIV